MKRIIFLWFVTAVVVTGFCISAMGQDDYWTPAGAPLTDEGKMKTLDQVEPRTPIINLPFTISNPGSYYLIHSLNGLAGSNGIIIAASEVQLDMNGFGLFGGSNSMHGIYIPPAEGPGPPGGKQSSISIRNGAVIEWGGWGINATNACQSEFINMKAMMNQGRGIHVGQSCLLDQCVAGNNVMGGIVTDLDGTITDCKANKNGGNGIEAGPGNRVSGCTTVQNGMDGIKTGDGTTIIDCKSFENTQDGIECDNAGRISGGTAVGNGNSGIKVKTYCIVNECMTAFNTNNGIVAECSCLITDNLCGNNGKGAGSSGSAIVVLNAGNRIENNNLTANYNGIEVKGEGNWIANNTAIDNEHYGIIVTNGNNMVVCNAAGSHIFSSTNFVITENNQYGAIRPHSNGYFTSTNAWANFTIIP